ncbi:hypothetical protein Misp05_12000 [Micromonospora sp. NBRC 107095]|nr:hypothetical protein Misp05_12000 [Micromonospora sp. NBRC 107095]
MPASDGPTALPSYPVIRTGNGPVVTARTTSATVGPVRRPPAGGVAGTLAAP